ncbi:L,D-transpeptidase [Calothrix sp. 336/3]|uniref:L,D-transpeptidase n=1 Tax=Calothrix sp. 336/3 TaxID=1337936 RepID=UPI0004E3F7C3|nr:L,D-transpeptidase [Calothrix sp. 336/3]AKG21010.1 hypothetical protein IJ00_06595 [Calothrix sp. 336/3]
MFLRLSLVSLSLLMFAGCTAHANSLQPNPTNSNIDCQQIANSLEQNHVSPIRQSVPQNKAGKTSRQSYNSATSRSYMTLSPTKCTNAVGNPLYKLSLYANGQLVGTYLTVSGRADTQSKNRHRGGTKAPLPDGKYTVAKGITAGVEPEVGDRFLAIHPTFRTGRSALGIHYDPSFEKKNGEDGTSGCIGLRNKQELDQVLNYVRQYHPQYLQVKIL